MKNYAYIIFFDHFIRPEISSIHTKMVTSHSVTHPQSAPEPSMLNFQVPLAWAILTHIIPYWYYYPFNPYKP
jgi:hypothetical protein